MHIFHRFAVSLVVLLVVAACTPSNSTSSESSGTSGGMDASRSQEASTPAPDPVDIAEQKSTEAYLGMWDAYVDASATSDWQSPHLARFATGTALSTLTQGLHTAYDKGLIARGEPVLRPSVSSVEPVGNPTKAIVFDCGDSTNWTSQRADNGAPADEPGGRRRINAVVEKQADGSWMVTDFGVHEVGSC
ncbi:hypothetical protein [Umezawaea tangerina]|nr:hypothetical protein [Umezawaea tangerina]